VDRLALLEKVLRELATDRTVSANVITAGLPARRADVLL
jgi:hypothetical protein